MAGGTYQDKPGSHNSTGIKMPFCPYKKVCKCLAGLQLLFLCAVIAGTGTYTVAEGAADVTAFGKFAVDSIFNETARLYEGGVDTIASGEEGLKSAVNATITEGAGFVAKLKHNLKSKSKTPLPASTTPALTSTLVAPTSTPNVTSTVTTTSTPIVTSTLALTSTPATTSTQPMTTTVAPISTTAPDLCANAASLTFSGTSQAAVGIKGPFSFPEWQYDFLESSVPAGYQQSIFNTASFPGPQVINVTAPSGILLCGIAGSGYDAPINATIQGRTLADTTVSKSGVAFPLWTIYANVTFDATWQPLQSILITATGDPETGSGSDFTAEIWEISYVVLAT